MKVFLIIGLLFFNLNLFTQNLVPNFSFENFTSCPNGASQLTLAYPWVAPTNNNVEYLNACSSNISSAIPQNINGFYLYPRTGNACSAFWAYNTPGDNYREYIQVQLTSSLQNISCYYVEYYIFFAKICKYSIKDIFLNFSSTQISSTGTGLILNLTKSISPFGNKYLNDTLNWIKISGIYTANGGENYITIGNFDDDAHTDTLNNITGSYSGSYYFIDDVSVIPVDSLNLPAFAGNDISINAGDSAFIGQEITNLNCNWYILGGAQIAGNISGLYVKPTVTTTYVVEQYLCGNISYDTVMVKVNNTGIKEHNNDFFNVSIYPNPANNKITIIPENKDAIKQITISDITGRQVYFKKSEVYFYQTELDISFLQAGNYIVTISTVNNVYNKKLIIARP